MLTVCETCHFGFRSFFQNNFSDYVLDSGRCTLEEHNGGDPLRQGLKGVSKTLLACGKCTSYMVPFQSNVRGIEKEESRKVLHDV